MRYELIIILLFICLFSCTKKSDKVWVNVDEHSINDLRGVLKCDGLAFTGVIYKLYANSDTEYVKRYYDGKLNGVSKCWYKDGGQKYVYSYKDGVFDGVMKEWFPNGKLYRVFHYIDGQEEGMQTMYWDNGKLRANYQSKNGRKYGLTGIKNCSSPWSDSLKQLFTTGGM